MLKKKLIKLLINIDEQIKILFIDLPLIKMLVIFLKEKPVNRFWPKYSVEVLGYYDD